MLTALSVALQVERFGNSTGMNYKLDHITYSNALVSFFSLDSRVILSVKWYTLTCTSCITYSLNIKNIILTFRLF
jgi:hypothetical protein